MKDLKLKDKVRTLAYMIVMVLIIFAADTVVANATDTDDVLSEHVLTNEDTEEERTNLNEPGTAETPDDLKELNIGNTFTITYDNGNGELSGTLRVLLILTMISLAPILLVTMTSFTRILIVLHFTRQALNTSSAPPNQILIAISLFLTFFIMEPTFSQMYDEALIPFEAGEITFEEAVEIGMEPMRDFMCTQTQAKDADAFMQIAGLEWDGSDLTQIPTRVLVPSFIISELRSAFIIGFLIYIPFIVIDMVVASVLMSMGMMMLPPTTISMPFKILLFVLADGWNLVIVDLVKSFY